MQIFVKTLSGNTITLSVDEHDTFSDVKQLIQCREQIPASALRLLHSGKQMANGICLSDAGVVSESTLHMTLCLLGGAKKRKKKVYTSAKKNKHKNKKVKLKFLKYFNVSDKGKVERLREECKHPDCGPGLLDFFFHQYLLHSHSI